ncbi:MAG TPA: thiol:disulfide interchange protein DsbA/DsbL [Methylophilaceae bacterium]|nr:thiol:disulfide interchange protein DsbA/DsbL [Methylophilaceae bacterium]HQR60495.1 thiol:disulfide interchange protein DsbA/DsbL [Methylophilaceae bacterium]
MKVLLSALLLLVSSIAAADSPFDGRYEQTLQPIPTGNAAKIEVVELFWYGCPHCYDLEPALAAWVKKLPKDVEFKRVPGLPNPSWAPMAKAYYTMEALGIADKLHSPLFDAIHKQRTLKPNDEAGTIDWIIKQSGLDRKKVEDAYNSFSVNTKVTRAAQIFRASGATGVPAIIVDGKYLTSIKLATKGNESISAAQANEQLFAVTDYLIDQLRKEKAAKR